MNTAIRFAAVALFALATAACTTELGAPQASMGTIDAVRQANLPAMNVGDFARGPNLSASDDASVTVRAVNSFAAPGGSFAAYLKATLVADLKAAGRLDAASSYVLQGALTQSYVTSQVGTGHATVGAKFTLTKAGKTVFEKELSVEASWSSSFVGAEAIPDAVNNYTGLYEKLAEKLFSDPDFKAALAQ